MSNDSPVMTIDETAEYLKIAKCTVYVLVQSPNFPAIKLGKEWRIYRPKLDQWIIDKINDK